MDRIKEIISGINQGTPKPIYFLMGEEPYYIDKISQYIPEKLLSVEEREFNHAVLYGKETNIEEVVANAKRFPMMAQCQVLIVKEAQHLSRTIEHLTGYAENPQPSTILVLCYKYKKLDKRKKLYKAIQKNGMLYESKKMYENQAAEWIRRTLGGKKYRISPKACLLLVEFLGTGLGRINNELEKLMLVVPKTEEITPRVIERNIGFNKDFNNFELKRAIGERDMKKVAKIIGYFSNNPKDNPFVVTASTLHTFFTQLLQYHGITERSPKNVANVLGVNPYFTNEYAIAAKNYSMKRVSQILGKLRELDLKGKGVDVHHITQTDLLKELLAEIG